MVCSICSMQSSLWVNMVKLMAVVFVVLAISQTQAFPTNGRGVEIDFSEDSNIASPQGGSPQVALSQGGPPQFAPPAGKKIEFLQGNKAHNLPQGGPPQFAPPGKKIEFLQGNEVHNLPQFALPQGGPPQFAPPGKKIEFLQGNKAHNLPQFAFPQGGPPQFAPPGKKIEFLQGNEAHNPPQGGPSQFAPPGKKIEFLQGNDAHSLEEALFTYTRLLMNKKSGIQPFQEDLKDNWADEQSTALCSEEPCDCAVLKYGTFQGTRTDNGHPCTLGAVPYCEGVCPGSHRYYIYWYLCIMPCSFTYRYNPVEDGPGAEPTSHETYQCCLSTGTVKKSLSAYCVNGNEQIYQFIQEYDVPGGCACSSSSPCSRR